jgi:hypothetical protein
MPEIFIFGRLARGMSMDAANASSVRVFASKRFFAAAFAMDPERRRALM